MATFRLERPGKLDVEFTGDLLADLNSREDDAVAWSEVRIYRTDSGKYVVESLGKHVDPERPTRGRVRVLDTAGEVPGALMRRGFSRQDRREVEYLTDLAVEALEVAATKDEALRGVLVERI